MARSYLKGNCTNEMPRLLVSLVLLFLCAVAFVLVDLHAYNAGIEVGRHQERVVVIDQLRYSYWRGIFDLCLAVLDSADGCNASILKASNNGTWYEVGSPLFSPPPSIGVKD